VFTSTFDGQTLPSSSAVEITVRDPLGFYLPLNGTLDNAYEGVLGPVEAITSASGIEYVTGQDGRLAAHFNYQNYLKLGDKDSYPFNYNRDFLVAFWCKVNGLSSWAALFANKKYDANDPAYGNDSGWKEDGITIFVDRRYKEEGNSDGPGVYLQVGAHKAAQRSSKLVSGTEEVSAPSNGKPRTDGASEWAHIALRFNKTSGAMDAFINGVKKTDRGKRRLQRRLLRTGLPSPPRYSL